MSPLPWEPFESSPEPREPGLREQVSEHLARHRRKRGDTDTAQSQADQNPENPIAAAVAERYARSVSYQEYLTREAREQRERAEAAAEIARRNAEAIADAERNLREELAEWNARIAEANAANPYLSPGEQAAEVFEEKDTLFLAQARALEDATISATEEIEPAAPTVSHAEMVQALEPVVIEPNIQLPTNVIAFPRQLVAPRKARPRLAEGPLVEEPQAGAQLRIFEVEADQISHEPEVENTLPEWSSIRLDAHKDQQAFAANQMNSFLMPPQPAPFHQRVMAGTVDFCILGASYLLFVAVAAWAAPVLPTGKMALGISAAVLAFFWIGYQMLFFSFSHATPGMRYARIGLCTFADENPSHGAMRMRVLATLLSAFPAGLGLLWALMDDEKLGWNDRISRMYQRSY